MKRGEVWTVAGGPQYAGKPRPVVVIQHDRFDATESVTICPFTTNPLDAPFIRLLVEPGGANGLRLPCRLMVDKISTVPRAKLRTCLGRLDAETVVRLSRAIFVFLGLAEPVRVEKPRRSRAASAS
jgi:mRNA interferase MazF